MTPADSLLPRVWAALVSVAGADRVTGEPGADCPLGPNGFWLDSIDLMDAIIACEDAFGITFALDTDFDASRLRTVGDLVNLVRERGGQ